VRLAAKIIAGVVLVVLADVALNGVLVALTGPPPMRGEMVDIGGRRLHLICEGPKSASPTVLLEAGAFGFSADMAVIQDKLAAQGLRACAYDRAGLGLSDPGPAPRDGLAVVGDLEKLLAAAHEPGPYILVGHSMAGLYLRLFAGRNPDKVAGLVLIDAATPEITDTPSGQQFVAFFTRASRLAALGARAGLYRLLAGTWFGDKIGLTPAASAEKRRAFASPTHNCWASAEIDQWLAASGQAAASGVLNPAWPVAVVVADHGGAGGDMNSLRAAPARQSRHGYFERVAGAGHANLLGVRFADAAVRGVDHVRAAISSP
jgi:pimeloyl-ACP methyl ester carboxylesterase